MTRRELDLINTIDKSRNKPISVDDLFPYLENRTLIYGYTCERRTFHVYIKDKEIHTIIYDNDYSDEIVKPKNMREISVETNYNYVPDKRIYPECCDFQFCKLLNDRNIELPFTSFSEDRLIQDFYGFTLEDMC